VARRAHTIDTVLPALDLCCTFVVVVLVVAVYGIERLRWVKNISYCAIELPTAENMLVALDPMTRTVPTTSKTMIAEIMAYSATS
jgi:hypothetical protein